jgi:hypothetical protein
MRPFWRQELLIASIAVYAAACFVIVAFADAPAPSSTIPDMVELPPTSFSHRSSGEFIRNGRPAAAPLLTAAIPYHLATMRHQAANTRRATERSRFQVRARQ